MADELGLIDDPTTGTGQTVTANVYDDVGATIATGIACTEVGTTGMYFGDMPATGAGEYIVRFFASGDLIGQTVIHWDGTREWTGNPATDIVEDSETMIEGMRLMRAEAAGKVSVVGNIVTFRNAADTGDRITATVDNDGQRTAVTVDGS